MLGNSQHPTLGNGKSATSRFQRLTSINPPLFTERFSAGRLERVGDGSIAFNDGVGEVSGTWMLGRKAMTEPGLLIYIMVDNATAAVEKVIAHGGRIVQSIGADAPEITARFSDPAGNVFDLYQQRP